MAIDMTNQEVVQHLKQWVTFYTEHPIRIYKFPTMACGHVQNMKFMEFINKYYSGDDAIIGVAKVERNIVDVVMDYIYHMEHGGQ